MRKIILIILFSCINVISAASPLFKILNSSPNDAELDLRKTLFPHALITDGFGILDLHDLALSSCDAVPIPFGEDAISYPFWQCFAVRKVKFWCDPAGTDGSSPIENGLIWINVKTDSIPIIYVSRRAFPLDDCKSLERDWKKATKGQEHVCLQGPYSGIETYSGFPEQNWTFNMFKTKLLCRSFFSGDCDFKERIKDGCKIWR